MVAFISRAIIMGIPLLFGATGETITEKSGQLNLGIPGIMYIGAISGVIGAFFYENSAAEPNAALGIIIPLVCCLVGSVLAGLIYGFFTITLRSNQNVTGLAMTTFGVGLGNFFGGSLIKLTAADVPSINLTTTSNFFKMKLPFASDLGWFGELFLNYSFLAYVAVVIAVITAIMMKKTRVGLHLRAVGESPATADAAGINVTKYKYAATLIGSAIAGLGGLYYIMDYACGVWSNNGFGDRGWLAIALVIFTIWKTDWGILGSFLFGGLLILNTVIPGLAVEQQELIKATPYVITIIVLIIVSAKEKRESQPPKSLGLPYFREER